MPIKDILLQLFPATLELSLAALAISSVLGSILGILSALKKGSIGDNVLTVFGMIGVSHPPVLLRYAVYPRLCAGLGDLARLEAAWRRERRGYGTTSNI